VCLLGSAQAPGVAAQDSVQPAPSHQLDPEAPSSYFDVTPVHADDQPVHALLDEMRRPCTRIEKRCQPGTHSLLRPFQGGDRGIRLPVAVDYTS